MRGTFSVRDVHSIAKVSARIQLLTCLATTHNFNVSLSPICDPPYMARRWTTEEEDFYREELLELYVRQNKTINEVGAILSISPKRYSID